MVTYPPGAETCTGLTSLIPYIYFKKIHASGKLEIAPLDADAMGRVAVSASDREGGHSVPLVCTLLRARML